MKNKDPLLVSICQSVRKARKTHLCECGKEILPGEHYRRSVVKYDKKIFVSLRSYDHATHEGWDE